MDSERTYQIRIELTKALLAAQMMRRERRTRLDRADLARIVERSVQNLRALMSDGDLGQEVSCDGHSRERGEGSGILGDLGAGS